MEEKQISEAFERIIEASNAVIEMMQQDKEKFAADFIQRLISIECDPKILLALEERGIPEMIIVPLGSKPDHETIMRFERFIKIRESIAAGKTIMFSWGWRNETIKTPYFGI